MSRCAICGGLMEEHTPSKTRHVFTQREGEMKTWEEQASEERREAASRAPAPKAVTPVPTPTINLERLIMTLHTKGLLDDEDLLYIAYGMKKS